MTSVFAIRDEDCNPLICECGEPVTDQYPHPISGSSRCYFCTAKYFKDSYGEWPEELKLGETEMRVSTSFFKKVERDE